MSITSFGYSGIQSTERRVNRSFFDGLPGRDAGIECRGELKERRKSRLVLMALILASGAVTVLAVIGAHTVYRYLVS
jgi:hypothetical protein